MQISVFIITRNEEKNIARCLAGVRDWADEIVVVDSQSDDRTVEIAESFGARVVQHEFRGFVEKKNFALEQCMHPWVFNIDADEEVSPALRREIMKLKPRLEEKMRRGVRAYAMPRLSWYGGRWIRHGDFYPDYVGRLFAREGARFGGCSLHAGVQHAGRMEKLRAPLFHYSYKDAADHRARIEPYATQWATFHAAQGRRAGAFTPYLRAAWCLLRGFVLKRGFLDGRPGFDIARLTTQHVFFKYSKLRALQKTAQKTAQTSAKGRAS